LKTECWYVLESRDGVIYKGVEPGVQPETFRRAIETDTVEQLVRRVPVTTGDFHYLPAGTVHALGAGVVVAEVQTPSDTTYRVTDWGRGRDIHVERAMQCIHFHPSDDRPPGAAGETLLVTDHFTVARRRAEAQSTVFLPAGRCSALMILRATGRAELHHAGRTEPVVPLAAGQTVLLPAALSGASLFSVGLCEWLEITLPESS